ncbi:MAG TPA: sodium:proton antiporter [Deltaproteobacteria bacterium]|nr:sodium:proton antiporter [Deltaproteobacteria bacterium]
MSPLDGDPRLTFALALVAGMSAQALARHLRIPGIVFLLVAGVALGPDGLAWIQPRQLGGGLPAIVDFAVAIILFEGGLNLEISRLRREGRAIRRLVTLGALLTLLGGAAAAHVWLGWNPMQSLLFGALVVVTGPTVVGPLVSELRLKPRVATVLEAEGVLIDPIGAILAVVMLRIVLSGDPGSLVLAHGGAGLARLAAGMVLGIVAGFALAWMLRMSRLLPEGLENVTVLSVVLLLYAGSEALLSHSGVLAVTVAGIVVGNVRTRVERDLREFKDQLTVMLIGLLFVILAADVRFEQVAALGWAGFGVVGTLVLVVRPLSVWLCTFGSDLDWRERLFVGWVAPRGIVAAAIASLVAVELGAVGLSGGVGLRALVFLTIAVTVALAGLSAGPIGSLLGVRLRERDTVAILGTGTLGLALAEELRRGGVPVVMLDSNPEGVRRAQEAGFTVVFGNALNESVMQRARFGLVRTVVALTANRTLNGVFVERARSRFGVPNGLVAVTELGIGIVSEQIDRGDAKVVFDGPHDIERWDVRGRRGDVEIARFAYSPAETAEGENETTPQPGLDERYVILSVERDDRTFVMDRQWKAEPGDRAAIALHRPEREEAIRALAERGWHLPGDVEREGSDA